MALILDPITGEPVHVTSAGSMLVSPGGDGYPTYFVRMGPAIGWTAATAVGQIVWGMRAPTTRTVDIRHGRVRLGFNGTAVAVGAAANVGIEFHRFSGSDFTGGTTLLAQPKQFTEGAALTTMIRETTGAAAITGPAAPAAGTSFASLVLPTSTTGGSVDMALEDWNGMLLAPGEGMMIRTVGAAPIGTSLSGWIEFSERTD